MWELTLLTGAIYLNKNAFSFVFFNHDALKLHPPLLRNYTTTRSLCAALAHNSALWCFLFFCFFVVRHMCGELSAKQKCAYRPFIIVWKGDHRMCNTGSCNYEDAARFGRPVSHVGELLDIVQRYYYNVFGTCLYGISDLYPVVYSVRLQWLHVLPRSAGSQFFFFFFKGNRVGKHIIESYFLICLWCHTTGKRTATPDHLLFSAGTAACTTVVARLFLLLFQNLWWISCDMCREPR